MPMFMMMPMLCLWWCLWYAYDGAYVQDDAYVLKRICPPPKKKKRVKSFHAAVDCKDHCHNNLILNFKDFKVKNALIFIYIHIDRDYQ